MLISGLRTFFRLEAAGGIVLFVAAVAALAIANSPLAGFYTALLALRGVVQLGPLVIAKPLLLWINELWMAIFFFLVGLEIKREALTGMLARRSDLMLPVVAAIGGMTLPALIYAVINLGHPETLSGWAIPAATDIAFALGVMALLGRRAPTSLKVLLTAIAILDDLGAIVIIALFYTANLSAMSLLLAAFAVGGLVALNRCRVAAPAAYIIVGAVLWVCVLKSGVHSTLAGVATALAIPQRATNASGAPVSTGIEHALQPWVAFLILPVFAFVNAGVPLAGVSLASLAEPVTLGIVAGLVIGKQLGVFLPMLVVIRAGWARLPDGATTAQTYGMAVLCGIGFTMSLFIGSLAFETEAGASVRLGVLGGSIVSAVAGYLVLRLAGNRG